MKKNMILETTQYIDAALALHGLELNLARRAEVEMQFNLLEKMYLSFADEPIPDDTEPANIFRL